jgi:lipoprotein-releasing system permease protein
LSNVNLSFFIARRYLVKQKGTFSSFIIRLAIIATALSVAVMIVALAVVTGFKYSISEKLFSFMGHVQVTQFDETGAGSFGVSEPIYADPVLFGKLKEIGHVKAVSPFVVRPAIVQAENLLEGISLKGVNSNYRFSKGITTTGAGIDYGDTSYSKDLLLSKTTAERLNVRVGDTVRINFIDASGPRIRKVRVSGLYHSGMEDMDKFYAVCDIRLLQRINNWPADSINGYQLDLDDPQYADSIASYIHFNLILAPVAVNTTVSNYTFIFDWLQLQGINSAILIIIMTIVAVINLGAALLILIVDRAVMIGLLKALGMPYESMRNIFLGIAALIGGAGILLGNTIAIGLCMLQLKYGILKLPEDSYNMRYAPVKIIWWQVGLVDVGTLVLCIFCMWLPTLYIRRVQPAKVLQFK